MLPTLNRQSKYLLVCDDGRLSEAAAFLLIRYGFDAQVLVGGMVYVPQDHLVLEATQWAPSRSLVATASSARQREQSNLPSCEADTALVRDPAQQKELSGETDGAANAEFRGAQATEETGTDFSMAAAGTRAGEGGSNDPARPTDDTPTLDALLFTERSGHRGPEKDLAALKRHLQALNAARQESLLRERDLTQRLTDSEKKRCRPFPGHTHRRNSSPRLMTSSSPSPP